MRHRAIPLPRPDRLAVIPVPAIEAAIDRLIDALDARDGDPDLEPNGDEGDYSLGDAGHCITYGVDQSGPPLGELAAADTFEAREPRWGGPDV